MTCPSSCSRNSSTMRWKIKTQKQRVFSRGDSQPFLNHYKKYHHHDWWITPYNSNKEHSSSSTHAPAIPSLSKKCLGEISEGDQLSLKYIQKLVYSQTQPTSQKKKLELIILCELLFHKTSSYYSYMIFWMNYIEQQVFTSLTYNQVTMKGHFQVNIQDL